MRIYIAVGYNDGVFFLYAFPSSDVSCTFIFI